MGRVSRRLLAKGEIKGKRLGRDLICLALITIGKENQKEVSNA